MGDKLTPKRGEIFLVNFDPTVGAEIRKTRPALIIQNDVGNQYSPITIAAAITTFRGGKLYPTEIKIEASEGGLDNESLVLLNQIRSVDTERLVRKLGRLSEARMKEIDMALLISLGIIKL